MKRSKLTSRIKVGLTYKNTVPSKRSVNSYLDNITNYGTRPVRRGAVAEHFDISSSMAKGYIAHWYSKNLKLNRE